MKIYKCECGREFTNSQSFNGHKSHCKVHLQLKGTWEDYLSKQPIRFKKLSITNKKKATINKKKSLEKWISEKHICEHCGKVMTEKYGSGRFCCEACAHSHKPTTDQLQKIKEFNSQMSIKKRIINESKYYEHPNYCKVCGNVLSYDKRRRKVCCHECLIKLIQQQKLELCAKQGTNLCGKGIRGYYKGYYCQSSWELAYVIYNIDHGINFIRNKEGFKYILNNIERTYFPDFYLLDTKEYVEIKGYYDSKTKEKEKQFPKNKKLKILCLKEMKPILNYVKEKYGKDFSKLYNYEEE